MLKLKIKDLLSLSLASPLIVIYFLPIENKLFFFLIATVIIILFTLIEMYRRRQYQSEQWGKSILNKQGQQYKQIQSLFSLYNILPRDITLPPLGGWSLDPDALNQIILQIEDRKPALILELGSGISTVLIAYVLKKRKCGRIISLEHDEKHFVNTKHLINKSHLEYWSEVKLAPLQSYLLKRGEWLWYSSVAFAELRNIEMLIIDGPPEHLQKLSRYPALPLLGDRLSSKALIILDDAARAAEKEILGLWQDDLKGLSYVTEETEKGLAMITIAAERVK